MLGFASIIQVAIPPTGWIKAIRTALGMSMQQLDNKAFVYPVGLAPRPARMMWSQTLCMCIIFT
jgi:hypothetical protein